MARLPYVNPGDLTEEGRRVYEFIAASRGLAGRPLPNIWRTWLNHPPAAEVVARMGHYVRYGTTLSREVTELATLAAAREVDGQYPFSQHVPLARKAGVREEAIAAVREGAEAGLTPLELAVVRYVREMLRDHRVGDATFQDALGHFGREGVVDLTLTAGYYALLGLALSGAFQTDLEPDTSPQLP